ncbi:hypothetical protein IWQ62_001425 [Dispira parvispora]|uniref:Uncharacterized protein n=1 Tax=Dispira parvispora TaxID=1520584 RepID=A0A9W8E3V5_9FUNG|nr:hypothetical protein IWQ62_001425 [Dispira parvispora]
MQAKFTIRVLLISAIALALAAPCDSQPISSVSHGLNQPSMGDSNYSADAALPSENNTNVDSNLSSDNDSNDEFHILPVDDEHPGKGQGSKKHEDKKDHPNGPLVDDSETTTTATSTPTESASTTTDAYGSTIPTNQASLNVTMDDLPIIDKPRPIEDSPDQVNAEKLMSEGVCDPLTELQQSRPDDYQLVVSCKDALMQQVASNPGATLPFSLTKESLGCITGSQAYHAFEAVGTNVDCSSLLSQ